MIAAGIKKEEYREIKPYWDKRLNKEFDIVRFTNGYNKNSPAIDVELKGITTGQGKTEWGGTDKDVYILKLGKVLNAEKHIAIPNVWDLVISNPFGSA